MQKEYSFAKGLFKTFIHGVIWIGPLVINVLPMWGNLTVSAALALLLNYLKQRFG